ncbi:MAG TPA: (S)-ureidoglycine aminohydrolase [Isosphaeraceae bacterium]|jgi:(S)-ureidoglycine aminohydrolase
MDPFGTSRSRVAVDHALICPDSFVSAPLAGWRGTKGVVLVSPRMGARFAMYLATLEPGGRSAPAAREIERVAYVLEGNVSVALAAHDPTPLAPGGFAYLAPDSGTTIRSDGPARLCVFERRYVPLAGVARPSSFAGSERDAPGEPFLGDPDARLRVLLPDEPGFDLAVNVFTYQPGATLPMVEVHVMEHGLLMLEGQGVYRLGDAWYSVREGDAIWMAPYCPQWFVAMGKEPARYLYYKDVNRDPLAAEGG